MGILLSIIIPAYYELQQVLAEVYEEYKNGKKFLQIPEKFKEQVSHKNKSHKIDDGIKGIIEGYLQDKKICCVQEIYQNAIKPLGIYNWSKSLSSKIADIIVRVDGWRRYTSSKDNRFYFKEFGKQIAFERYETEEEERERLKQEENKKAELLDRRLFAILTNRGRVGFGTGRKIKFFLIKL